MVNPDEYPISTYATLFPEIAPEEYAQMVVSIGEVGLLDPVTLWREQVIDGRHRLKACREAGVEPRFERLSDDDDPLKYVIAKNAERRHLTSSQRGVVAHKLSAWSRPGGDKRSADHSANLPNGFTQQQASALIHVSPRTVRQASRVFSAGSPAVQDAVERGQITVSDAARVISRTADIQERALAEVLSGRARTINAAVNAILRERTPRDPPPQPAGPYRTIVIDPPWPVGYISRGMQPDRQDAGSPTMSVEEIARIELPLADNAFVFLWTTEEHLPHALRILERWKLEYRFTMVWQKDGGIQPPDSCRHNCEFIVVGARGEPRFTSDRSYYDAVFTAPCQDPLAPHSVKPSHFYDLLRRFVPGPRLELPEGGTPHFQVYRG